MEIEGHLLIQGEGDPSMVSTAPGGKESKETQQPQKKYRLTEQMKSIVWQLVLLSNECCRLENEKKYGLLSFSSEIVSCSYSRMVRSY